MDLLLLLTLSAAPVPDVVAGPALASQATALDAPIRDVTVYSDRAQVAREVETRLAAGVHVLRLPDLPGGAFEDTVRVGAKGAKVIRVEVTPVERERVSLKQVDELIDRLEALQDRVASIDDRMAVLTLELAFLGELSPVAPVPEAERVGKPLPPVLPEVWGRVMDFLGGRRAEARKALRGLSVERRKLQREAEALQREIDRQDLGGASDQKLQVLAILQVAQAGRAKLALEYFVPGASWVPAYELRFSGDVSQVAMATAGLVQQATGEDWEGVDLHLSTAVPGRSIELPELLTWTLGEQKEWIPRPQARRAPKRAARLAPPRPTDRSDADEYAMKIDDLEQRVNDLKEKIFRSKARLLLLNESVLVGGGVGDAGGGRGRVASRSRGKREAKKARPKPRRSRARAKRRAPPRPSAAPARPSPEPSAPMAYEAVAELSAPAEAAGMLDGFFGSDDKPRERTRSTSLALFEPGSYRRPTFSDRDLPAVTAGGLDYVWDAPAPATIPSSGDRVRVPLSVEQFQVTAFYEATPSLSKVAYLKATVRNKGQRPVLAGAATVFVGGEFGGDVRLETTGPGGVIELPLGADEDVRLTHSLVPATETVGLISKRDRTRYTSTIEIGNYKKRPIRIHVFDVLPKTRQEEIEIALGKTTPSPADKPDADGLVRWELDVAAGATTRISYSYRITRPEDWRLRQR